MKYLITISIVFFYSLAYPCHAQLSGEVDLGGGSSKSEAAPPPSIKEITVTGMGTTLESAEKQALASAIRQAVGAYMDSKTIVENEGVIQDRILSVSHAFVEKYEVVGQTKKSSDGLIEITILAKIKTNQVVQALKENNLISGEVAGQNLWAEASTKVMNAQDAVAMLQAKMPELIKACVTITPLDENGIPMINKDGSGLLLPSMKPAQTKENPETGKVTLTWFFETGVDKKYYRETFIPLVKECMDAIYGPATLVKQEISKKEENKYTWSWDDLIKTDFFTAQIDPRHYDPILIHSITKSFDRIEYYSYLQKKYFVDLKWEDVKIRDESGSFILVELIDNKGETISSKEKSCWNPFHLGFDMIGINSEERRTYASFQSRFITKIALSIPIDSLKEVSKVQVTLDVHNSILTLKSRDR